MTLSDDYSARFLQHPLRIKKIRRLRKLALSDDLKPLVDRLWEEEKQRLGDLLYNGKIFCVKEAREEELEGFFIDYKLHLARQKNLHIRKALPFWPVSICCMTLSAGKILVGLRDKKVAHYPSYWELAPCGGIDDGALFGDEIDWQEQVIREFVEETGYSQELIESLEAVALVCDEATHTLEIVVKLFLKPTVAQIEGHATDEYQTLQWLESSDIDTLSPFVPLCRYVAKLLQET